MATLFLSRPPHDFALLRRILVTVDGRRVAGIRPGQSTSVTVPSGQYLVQASLDWTRSETLTVQVGDEETVALEVSCPVRAYWQTWIAPSRALGIRRA
ncbi:hypothetical protein ACSNN7_03190 [Micromonospora sp. URMC 105]|uniref:hypothetical protein n=1 Tax=Micromonospora sp. URMC 105 TaxID=3423413 RepID=UPI003F1D6716